MRIVPVSILWIACAAAQEPKHLSVATLHGLPNISVRALNIERPLNYGGIIHLKGDVEIRMPTCVPGAKPGELNCNGEIVIHADEADLHEDTGQVQPRGNVTVTPQRP
jgi:lipopolysaccharide assembly outer membrane protein LptD (OstA)